MRILISNDDGIDADGIRALTTVMATVGDVTVVAPDTQRSASSHGISLHRPIVVKERGVPGAVEAYQTSGTPVDCVKWALATLHRQNPFDIVLSGINEGANLATDILYSGTVAIAGEAALQGVKAIAFSHVGPPFDFAIAADVSKIIFELIYPITLPPDTFINVNIPLLEGTPTWTWTDVGVRRYHDVFTLELDAEGRQVYRYGGDLIDLPGEGETDIRAVANGQVSLTPLRFGFTHQEFLNQLRKFKP
ncbi:5'/3'-nucleotidase SurE [Alicyclobacillus acidiphilus]|uniref:5'/3'-nucleotidase SurE n=1 Tax=Alicyclobacillus acidiphilus TaxID=182455 RepID=UPI0009F86A76|nr:5'/3'-nucleotidase SurE [Alicyclobacillus acidiphilus]